ncbi:tyrosine-type recombinase/integrase [Sinomonas sp. RB5]
MGGFGAEGSLMARPRLEPGQHGEIEVSSKKNAKGKYRARARYRDDSGKRLDVTSEKGTKGEARAEVQRKLARLREGAEPPKPPTVAEVVWDWWEHKPLKKVDPVAGILEQTKSGYCEVIRRSVVPLWGGLPVDRLTAGRLQDELNSMVAGGTKYTEAKHVLTIMSQALQRAVLNDLVPQNVARECTAPRKKKTPPRSLRTDELLAVRQAARTWQFGGSKFGPSRSEYLADVIECQLGLGMRIGEALALKFEDVDWESNQVRIHSTLVERRAMTLKDGAKVPGWFGYQPFTKSGEGKERIVEAPSFVMEVLLRRLTASPTLNQYNSVFVTRKGTWVRPNSVRNHLRAALKQSALEIDLDWFTPHDLRATALTAIARAVDAEAAAEFAGHSDPAITREHYIEPEAARPILRAAILDQFAQQSWTAMGV